ncbi:EpsG family protein, partial [Enterococcus sp. JM9B]|uniref:EpsG family protein n=1 Tax=Enterococcus sp. JM9B TaxID=1857216 RepID=UPI00192A1ECA
SMFQVLDYNIWANMLIISSLLTLLGIQTVILSRLSTYFSFSSIIIVPYIAKQLFEEKDYKILRWVIIGLYFIFFIFEVDKFNRGEYLSELNLIFWTE